MESTSCHQLKIWVIDQSLHHGDLALIAAPGQDTYDLRLISSHDNCQHCQLEKKLDFSLSRAVCNIWEPSATIRGELQSLFPVLSLPHRLESRHRMEKLPIPIHKYPQGGLCLDTKTDASSSATQNSVHTVPTEPTAAYALHSDNVAGCRATTHIPTVPTCRAMPLISSSFHLHLAASRFLPVPSGEIPAMPMWCSSSGNKSEFSTHTWILSGPVTKPCTQT